MTKKSRFIWPKKELIIYDEKVQIFMTQKRVNNLWLKSQDPYGQKIFQIQKYYGPFNLDISWPFVYLKPLIG